MTRLPRGLITDLISSHYSRYGGAQASDFRVSVPSLKAQQITAKAVEVTFRTVEKAREQIELLEQLAETLILNWKDRDPETGKALNWKDRDPETGKARE